MKKLEIFKENIKFKHWGELYVGCKAEWITIKDTLEFCKANKIQKCDADRYVALLLALDDSLFDLYEQLKTFICEDDDPIIDHNEDSLNDFLLEYIPIVYFEIWELEFLLEIRNSELSNSQKLEQVFSLFDVMNYPEKWKSFLYYQPQANGKLLSEDELYQNFLEYIDGEIQKRK